MYNDLFYTCSIEPEDIAALPSRRYASDSSVCICICGRHR